jgi:hypothetical protein
MLPPPALGPRFGLEESTPRCALFELARDCKKSMSEMAWFHQLIGDLHVQSLDG